MARGNGARIMNIFAEVGQFICLQTHFFGSAVAVMLNSLHRSHSADQAAPRF